MSVGTQTNFVTGNISVSGSSNVKITNLNITSSNTEFSHSFVTNLKQCMIKSRIGAKIKACFVSGESGTNYITINAGTVFAVNDLSFSSKVLYIQADKVGIVEILELY